MAKLRQPLQGVLNIVRFNWHFFAIALCLWLVTWFISYHLRSPYQTACYIVLGSLMVGTLIPLLISFYVYDLFGLYRMHWLNHLKVTAETQLVNIHAGFDETSLLLQDRYPWAIMHVFDFYNPCNHTETSIKRARRRYPAFQGTTVITTSSIPLKTASTDYLLILFAAHEIRDDFERIEFFREVNRVLKPEGQLIIVEHLRDIINFLAYNIGAFHFLPKSSWHKTFNNAELQVIATDKLTPFVTQYTLIKHEHTP